MCSQGSFFFFSFPIHFILAEYLFDEYDSLMGEEKSMGLLKCMQVCFKTIEIRIESTVKKSLD